MARGADWRVRWFDPIDGRLIFLAKHLYVAYTVYGASHMRTSEVHRYDFSTFDVLGTAD